MDVPDEILENSVPLWEDLIVGRFPSAAPHVAKIHVIVNKIWNLGDRSIQIDAYSVNETTVKFRIRNVSARSHVLRRGMWNICDLPMIVSKWTPIVEDAQPEIKTMPMWVVIKNVPHSMFSWKGLSYLASPLGEPKRLHPETELVTSFDEAKIFVEVNLKQELPKVYYFKVQGQEVCVKFEYPWLPPKCGTCGKWGHFEAGCLANGEKMQEKRAEKSESLEPKDLEKPAPNDSSIVSMEVDTNDTAAENIDLGNIVATDSVLRTAMETLEEAEEGEVILGQMYAGQRMKVVLA